VVDQVEFGGKSDICFVEGQEEELEDLVDVDEEDGRVLVEFYFRNN
jgi:hypothetical protein